MAEVGYRGVGSSRFGPPFPYKAQINNSANRVQSFTVLVHIHGKVYTDLKETKSGT